MAFPLWANDSVPATGFWTRYAHSQRLVAVDTAFQQKILEQRSKRVSFAYDVDFETYFDNREYQGPYKVPQTIFNFRLSPSVGVRIRDNAGGTHTLMAGVRYTQRLGGNWSDVQFDPTAYYRYSYRGLNLAMGAIPYEQRLRALPDWLMYDSITYYHPNIQGALFSYEDQRGYVSFMCDWRSAQTQTRREMFRLLLDGEYHYKFFCVGGLAHMNHMAFANNEHDGEYLYDDVNLSAHIGFDVTQYTPLDSLALRVSYIYGYSRKRGANEIYQPQGVQVELYANWWFLGVKNTFYYGDNLQPFRVQMGADLYQGDPFYQSRLYNRTDLFVYLYRSSFVNFFFSWNMHYDTFHLTHQQQLCVRFNLYGLLNPELKNTYIRSIFDK